jgi:hypothetical protein
VDISDIIEVEKIAIMPFKKYPVCGGELVKKEVEKLLRGGVHTASLMVLAEVCSIVASVCMTMRR